MNVNNVSIFLNMHGQAIEISLSLQEAERFRAEFVAWQEKPQPFVMFHYADENVERFVRLDSIDHATILNRRVKRKVQIA